MSGISLKTASQRGHVVPTVQDQAAGAEAGTQLAAETRHIQQTTCRCGPPRTRILVNVVWLESDL